MRSIVVALRRRGRGEKASFPNLYRNEAGAYRTGLIVSAMNTQPDSTIEQAARQLVARAVAVVGLAGVALIHVLDGIDKFAETPYMGWMYVGLIIASLGTAAALIWGNVREAWLAALLIPLSAMAGFILTRTVGLPQATGDIGNWSEPLGVASLFVEACLVLVSGVALTALAPVKKLVRGRGRDRALVTA